MPAPARILGIARRALFAIIILGMVGTCAELLLLKHTEGFWQLVPITMLVTGVLVLSWSAVASTRAASHVLTALMALFVAAGATGVGLHLKGNIEWELERTPDLGGFPLVSHALMGATPALAPGTMLQFGLLGLLYGYLRRREPTQSHPDPLESHDV